MGELKMKINSNLEEEREEGPFVKDGTDNIKDAAAKEALPGLTF